MLPVLKPKSYLSTLEELHESILRHSTPIALKDGFMLLVRKPDITAKELIKVKERITSAIADYDVTVEYVECRTNAVFSAAEEFIRQEARCEERERWEREAPETPCAPDPDKVKTMCRPSRYVPAPAVTQVKE